MPARTMIRRKVTYANVVASLALILATGGTAWAVLITSAQIKNGTVKSIDLKNGGVASIDIKNGNVTSSDLGSASVATTKVGTVPAVAVRTSTSQSIPNAQAGATAITFPTERGDTSSMHTIASDATKLVAPIDGVYSVTGTVRWDGDAVNARTTYIQHTPQSASQYQIAVESDEAFQIGFTAVDQSVAGTVFMSAGDYVELRVYQNSGGVITVLSAEFGLSWIGPLT